MCILCIIKKKCQTSSFCRRLQVEACLLKVCVAIYTDVEIGGAVFVLPYIYITSRYLRSKSCLDTPHRICKIAALPVQY